MKRINKSLKIAGLNQTIRNYRATQKNVEEVDSTRE